MGSYKVLKASDVRQRWSEVVNEVARDKTRVIVEKSGVPVAGVVSPQDLEWLQERDRRMAELRETMDELRQALGDVPPEEFNRAVDRAVEESRFRTDGLPPARSESSWYQRTGLGGACGSTTVGGDPRRLADRPISGIRVPAALG
jgi:prevent-host-death family protein